MNHRQKLGYMVLFMGVPFTQSSCLSAYEYYNYGNIAYLHENYEVAIDFYTKAINQTPSYRDAYVRRGEVYYTLKRYDAAIADYNRAIEILPLDAASIYVSRAKVYQAKNDHDQAIKDCTTAIGLKPTYLAAYYERSYIYSYIGQHDKAIADCATARSLAPNDALANYNSGLAYESYGGVLFLRGEYDQALPQLTLAIGLYSSALDATRHRDPEDISRFLANTQEARARALLIRAGIYLQRDDMDNAISDISTTIQLEPDNYDALKMRGDLYYLLEQYREAIRDYTRLIELKPTDSVGYSLRGKAYRKAGDQASADADVAIAEQLK